MPDVIHGVKHNIVRERQSFEAACLCVVSLHVCRLASSLFPRSVSMSCVLAFSSSVSFCGLLLSLSVYVSMPLLGVLFLAPLCLPGELDF